MNSEIDTVLFPMDSYYIPLQTFFHRILSYPVLDSHGHCTTSSKGWFHLLPGKGACSTQTPEPELHVSPRAHIHQLMAAEPLRDFLLCGIIYTLFPYLWIPMSLQGMSVEIGLQVQKLLRWKEGIFDDEQTDGNCHQQLAHFFRKLCWKWSDIDDLGKWWTTLWNSASP